MSDYAELIPQAVDIAEHASKIALSYFRKPILIETKKNGTPTTVADKKTEEAIRKELEKAFPDHGIIGQELGKLSKKSVHVWTIDPIDGGQGFIRGIPLFGTLLGLLEKGKPVLGVMVLPALEEIYAAAKDFGTYCNGTQIHVSSSSSLKNSFVSTGDASCFESLGKKKLLTTLLSKVKNARNYTGCFGHSLVIRGSIDAMFDPDINIWDVAPVACLIREAGGDYFNFEGKRSLQSDSFISCNSKIKKEILRLLVN